MLLARVMALLVKLIAPVPVVERAEPTEMQLLVVHATRARLRFAGRLTADVTKMLPCVLLPIVSRLAVILPISSGVRPRLAELSAPPRFTPAPSVWISTLPDEVAFTVPKRANVLELSVIIPPLDFITADARLIPVPPVVFPGVLPVIFIDPVPVAEMLALEDSKHAPIAVDPVPLAIPMTVSMPLLVVTQPRLAISEYTFRP